jgi:hypothetical protein
MGDMDEWKVQKKKKRRYPYNSDAWTVEESDSVKGLCADICPKLTKMRPWKFFRKQFVIADCWEVQRDCGWIAKLKVS